jgi:TATA-box binding protein (TBP) (component of TFIID and TFIIIB)
MASFAPTHYKISTITATGSLPFESINLEQLYNAIPITEPDVNNDGGGFSYIEYGEKKAAVFAKGFHKKMVITRRKKKNSKRFDNQATVIIWMSNADGSITRTNMKVFKNANVQMTGLKTINQGKEAIQFMSKHLSQTTQFKAKEKPNANYRIRLINSDYKLGIEIKRDILDKIVQDYNIFCNYEPCIYPGVKIQYCYNQKNEANNGVCNCSKKCNGKGQGQGDGDCKRVTISVFQSGCVIITGAQSTAQIDEAYLFINELIEKNKLILQKQCLALALLPHTQIA